MLPEDEAVVKASEGDDNFQTLKLRTERYGYYYQFTRNMMYINQKDNVFTETALLSGVAATDWSWSVLMEDYNQDGNQDIFISNGIPKRPNDLDFIKFASSEKIKNKINQTKLVDKEAFDLMPSGKVHNYIFEGTPSIDFKDQSGKWISKDTLVSGATAFGDFDNDGDLDLIINNLNSEVSVLENQTNASANYLKIQLRYIDKNKFGIGTKVYSYSDDKLQYKELFTSRGFQASSEPVIHFGYSTQSKVDSIRVIWPNGNSRLLQNIPVNQLLTIDYQDTDTPYKVPKNDVKQLFTKVENNLNVNYEHKEDAYVDFQRLPLIPFKVSELGPAVAVGDLNEDGQEDIFFGSSKYKKSAIFLQTDKGFVLQESKETKDAVYEDVSAIIADFNNDQKNDLFIASGGADFSNVRPELADRILYSTDSLTSSNLIQGLTDNASVVISHDVDNDGDLDLFVGNNVVTNKYGQIPSSYILYNDNGFSKENIQRLDVGMVTDAIWSDFDTDGNKDLIIVGEWMQPTFLKNIKGKFTTQNVIDKPLNGLWQSVIEFDIDADGDIDYLLGNWGTNTKFTATNKKPLKLYHKDFDGNGTFESVVVSYKSGKYYTVNSFDELTSQMPFLRKKYPSYKKFAGQSDEQIFTKKTLKESTILEVHQLSSGYLENNNGKFDFVPFNKNLQVSPIKTFVKYDFDGDQKEEVLAAGNFFGVAPYHGRFDSFSGALIQGVEDVTLGNELGLDLNLKSARHLNIININKQPYLLVTFNNDKAQLYEINNE